MMKKILQFPVIFFLFIVLPGLGETGITTPHKTFDEAIATVKGMFEVD